LACILLKWVNPLIQASSQILRYPLTCPPQAFGAPGPSSLVPFFFFMLIFLLSPHSSPSFQESGSFTVAEDYFSFLTTQLEVMSPQCLQVPDVHNQFVEVLSQGMDALVDDAFLARLQALIDAVAQTLLSSLARSSLDRPDTGKVTLSYDCGSFSASHIFFSFRENGPTSLHP
ncbi:hypothetical protein, partial [Acinetobacter indicus]|uniref:hypothetical protein n=1 Tax=Acinetobacter indicus TaxID=756892 RepID=UPI001C0A0CB5